MKNNPLSQKQNFSRMATGVAMANFSTTLTGSGFAEMSPRRLMVQ
jgi:hypothetical protein